MTGTRNYLLKYMVKSKVNVPIALTKPIDKDYGQSFGNNFVWNGKNFYAQWGLNGHNGIDYPAPTGTNIIAPCNGFVSNYLPNETYGNNLWFYSDEWTGDDGIKYRLEMVFAHLDNKVVENKSVSRGEIIAKSGNSGYPVTSTGPHLHYGVRLQRFNTANSAWEIVDFDNGYRGYFNQYLITQDMFKLKKVQGTNEIYAVDDVEKMKHHISCSHTLTLGTKHLLWDETKIEEVISLSEYMPGSEIMLNNHD